MSSEALGQEMYDVSSLCAIGSASNSEIPAIPY
jgi:hypothetical protein